MKHASVLVDVDKDHHIIPTDDDVRTLHTTFSLHLSNFSDANVFQKASQPSQMGNF